MNPTAAAWRPRIGEWVRVAGEPPALGRVVEHGDEDLYRVQLGDEAPLLPLFVLSPRWPEPAP